MNKNHLKPYISFALLLLIFLTIWGCGNQDAGAVPKNSNQDKTIQPPAVEIAIQQLNPRRITDKITLPAETEPALDVLLASEQAGQIEAIRVQEGDRVQAGSILLMADVSLLKAELDRARAALELSSAIASRRKNLSSKRIISDEALDTALNQRTLAEVSLRQAEIRYKQGFVRSPIQGVVNELFVDPGEYVQEGQEVAEVVNVDRIRLVANIPEMDVRFLNAGDEVQVRIDALPEATWAGKIEFISFKAYLSTRTFRVEILVDNDGQQIRPGMIGRVRFVKRVLEEAITVPLTAILDKNGERMVFVEEEGFARARRVQIGVIENDRAQIISGLRVGENLIVSGQEQVEDGVKVSIR